ncbi:hypothetical protein [Methylobacillus flagellatus]|uniref:hypothetical protein n=1 Tax=Methylobacillus flagellatus TaxID=405 RepID=UPI0010F9B7CE|nr:hypothetical protein [Methylobacillus flagellatus]
MTAHTILARPGLMFDLSLLDNLFIATHLGHTPPNPVALQQLDQLFMRCGAPIAWPSLAHSFPEQVSATERAKIWISRALLCNPRVLQLQRSDWPVGSLQAEQFQQAYAQQFPWRQLVWLEAHAPAEVIP